MSVNIPTEYKLRWRLEYFDQKPDIYGPWDRGSDTRPCWKQSKSNLLYAVIEGENVRTHEIVRLSEMPGPKYKCHQWLAQVRAPGNFAQSIAPKPTLVALKMVGDTYCTVVFRDGYIQITQPNVSDSVMHYGREPQ